MVMTSSGGSDRRRLVKGSSSSKGKTFDQEGSAIDPIDVEPLSSAPLPSLVPYGTSEDEILAKKRLWGEGKLHLGESKCQKFKP